MKIYCFIKDDEIGVYDKENWRGAGKDVRSTSLISKLGKKTVKEFIDYVVNNYTPKENPLLKDYPTTFMYEIEL
jgi:hypothetical protein